MNNTCTDNRRHRLLVLVLLLLGLLHLPHEHGDGGGRREACLCGHHRYVPDGGQVVPQVHHIKRQRLRRLGGVDGRTLAAVAITVGIEGGQGNRVRRLMLLLLVCARQENETNISQTISTTCRLSSIEEQKVPSEREDVAAPL